MDKLRNTESLSKRRMVKFCRTENCISIQIIGRKHDSRKEVKSDRFLITKRAVEHLIEKEYIVTKDIYSFLEAGLTRDGNLRLEFTWLDSNGREVRGKQEYVEASWRKFVDWFLSDVSEYRELEMLDSRVPKIGFNSRKNLKEVLSNKVIKRKFIKRLMGFQNPRCDKVVFFDDSIPYSFNFSRYKDSKFDMNGGLIFHKDYDNPDDLSKGKYNVHT